MKTFKIVLLFKDAILKKDGSTFNKCGVKAEADKESVVINVSEENFDKFVVPNFKVGDEIELADPSYYVREWTDRTGHTHYDTSIYINWKEAISRRQTPDKDAAANPFDGKVNRGMNGPNA